MGLGPVNFEIKANGNDITALIKARLLLLQISDSQGDKSDSFD